MKFKAKVYGNKANGQKRVHIPKKMFELCPEEIELIIPDKFLKKQFRRKK